MNLGITFCTGTRCDKKQDCGRWTKNLELQLVKEKIDPQDIYVSVAEFSDADGKCDDFRELKK